MEELIWVHFPGLEIILEPSGDWDGLELEFPKGEGSGGVGGLCDVQRCHYFLQIEMGCFLI
jgi:hypothetical protein